MKKENIKLLMAILVSVVLSSSISIYAATCILSSSQVSYDNTNSGLTSTNVQASLDELYGHCTDYTSMDTRVASLETSMGNYFQNNPTSYFYDNTLNSTSIELNKDGYLSGYGGFIDFHYNGSTNDYTSRIIENSSGVLDIRASNGVKINGTNITSMFPTYITISCSGGESSTDCINKIKSTYDSLSNGTYVGMISAGHVSSMLISKVGNYGTVIRFSYPGGTTSPAAVSSMSIVNGTWGSWVSMH